MGEIIWQKAKLSIPLGELDFLGRLALCITPALAYDFQFPLGN